MVESNYLDGNAVLVQEAIERLMVGVILVWFVVAVKNVANVIIYWLVVDFLKANIHLVNVNFNPIFNQNTIKQVDLGILREVLRGCKGVIFESYGGKLKAHLVIRLADTDVVMLELRFWRYNLSLDPNRLIGLFDQVMVDLN